MRKSKMTNRLHGLVLGSTGSHLTREGRRQGLMEFLAFLYFVGIKLPRLESIRGKHLRLYVDHLLARAQTIRTIQKKVSYVRWLWMQIGRADLAQARDLTNAALGIKTPRGGRLGTNRPASAEQVEYVLERADKLRRPGLGMATRLMLGVGLRRNEVVHVGSDQLRRWLQQLEAGKQYLVVELGTKGGLRRCTMVADPLLVRYLLEEALVLTDRQMGRLILSARGRPVSLKSANNIVAQFFKRAGITPHQLRYRFASDRVLYYQSTGESTREACKLLAKDLGHGDGRGRYVRMVYCRDVLKRRD